MIADAPAPVVTHVEQRPAAWTLLRVGPTGRTLAIGAVGGGCAGPLRVTVAAQDAASVTLSATQSASVPDPGEQIACPAYLGFQRVFVTLDAPLDGRALTGQGRLHDWSPVLSGAPLPRLIGARARDASLSLRNQGYKVHLAGPIDGQVVREQRSFTIQNGRDVTLVAVPRR